MLFVDGGNDRVGINAGATPLRELDARDGDGVTSLGVGNNAAYIARSQAGTHSPALKFMASDGTLDSPTDTANGDYLGMIGFTGYHTNGYYLGAQIDAVLTGTNGTSDMPSALRFLTSADGSSTPSERMRILSAGGLTFNGDTAAANALDDYEEGTFTPSYTVGGGGSVNSVTSTNIGTYTKVGRMCTVGVTSHYVSTTGTVTYYHLALPFTASNTGGVAGGGFGQEIAQTGAGQLIRVENNTTNAIIWKYDGGAAAPNSYFSLSFTYQTA
jgi:hypothetical protein